MTVETFLDNQTDEAKAIFTTLHGLITSHDTTITAQVGAVMSAKEALVYNQEGVFKYGLTATKNHYSFHSMVMYANPDLLEELKQHTKGIKFQKGCLNFKTLAQVNTPAFEAFVKASAAKDFSPVLEHYKKKNKAK